MPFGYVFAPATNVTTNATPNTDTDHLRTVTAAARGALITALGLVGKGAGLTAISGIIVRMTRFATASTAGSAITARPKDPSSPAARTTGATGPTAGTTATVPEVAGCGAAGPGGWAARDLDHAIALEAGGGANGNLDLISQSGTPSLNFEYTLGFQE
jgi:hypothetical protein